MKNYIAAVLDSSVMLALLLVITAIQDVIFSQTPLCSVQNSSGSDPQVLTWVVQNGQGFNPQVQVRLT